MKGLQCCTCGVLFGMDDGVYCNRADDGARFFCTNGHGQSFTESTVSKQRRQIERLTQREAMLQDEITAANRRANAFKGQATKLRKRALGGTCPCCNRSFQNLTRHMKTKHPDFLPDAPEGAEIVPIARQTA